MSDLPSTPFPGGLAPAPSSIAHLLCLRRSGASGRIERVGVHVGGTLRHYSLPAITFALRLGFWRLWMKPAHGPELEVALGAGVHGETGLRVLAASDADDAGLGAVPLCTHALVEPFDVVG